MGSTDTLSRFVGVGSGWDPKHCRSPVGYLLLPAVVKRLSFGAKVAYTKVSVAVWPPIGPLPAEPGNGPWSLHTAGGPGAPDVRPLPVGHLWVPSVTGNQG